MQNVQRMIIRDVTHKIQTGKLSWSLKQYASDTKLHIETQANDFVEN